MKVWVLRLYFVLFVSACAFAENNYGDLVYSKDTTIKEGNYFYNEKSGKITINQGVKVTYQSSIDNRGYYENNGEIAKGESSIVFSNVLGATFINNGKMATGQFVNSGTATFYGDASAGLNASFDGFKNTGGGTFYIIGATLTTNNFSQEDRFYWNPPATLPTNTLIFGICDLRDSSKCGTKMGQINGNFINKSKSSVVNVNIANMVYNQKYTIITGAITGLDNVGFVGANLGDIVGHYENGIVWIEKKSTEPEKPNPDNPTPPPPQQPHFPSIKSNAYKIKEAIEDKFSDKVPAFDKMQGAVDLDNALRTSFVGQPKILLQSFKNNALAIPLNSAQTNKLTALNHAISFDNGYTPSVFEGQMQVFATPFATMLKSSELNGNLFGFAAGVGVFKRDYFAQARFAYARAKSEQEFTTQNAELNADLVQLAGFSRLFYGKVEADLGVDLIFGKFNAKNSWFDDETMNLNADFNAYQADLHAILGYRFGESLSLKPFAGVQTHFERQDSFRQNSGLNLQAEAYNNFVFGALLGLETRYIFKNDAFTFAKVCYESFGRGAKQNFMIKEVALSYENESYKNVVNISVGARIFTTKSFKIDIEALYQHYNDDLSAFGGNVAVRWNF